MRHKPTEQQRCGEASEELRHNEPRRILCVILGSHALVDKEHAETALIRCYAGIVNANGEVLIAGKCQRWADEEAWSEPFLTQSTALAAGWSAQL